MNNKTFVQETEDNLRNFKAECESLLTTAQKDAILTLAELLWDISKTDYYRFDALSEVYRYSNGGADSETVLMYKEDYNDTEDALKGYCKDAFSLAVYCNSFVPKRLLKPVLKYLKSFGKLEITLDDIRNYIRLYKFFVNNIEINIKIDQFNNNKFWFHVYFESTNLTYEIDFTENELKELNLEKSLKINREGIDKLNSREIKYRKLGNANATYHYRDLKRYFIAVGQVLKYLAENDISDKLKELQEKRKAEKLQVLEKLIRNNQ
jgi:hypothetical protein